MYSCLIFADGTHFLVTVKKNIRIDTENKPINAQINQSTAD